MDPQSSPFALWLENKPIVRRAPIVSSARCIKERFQGSRRLSILWIAFSQGGVLCEQRRLEKKE